jgi:hypothetical protein
VTDRIPVSDCNCELLDVARHLDQVLEIYERNPVRFARNRNQARQLFSLPKVPVWVATREGRVVAYLGCGKAINKKGIAEYGGELVGVLALLRDVVGSLSGLETLPLMVYPTRPDLANWANSLGLPTRPMPSSKGANHEMIYQVRPARIPHELVQQLFVWGLDQA